MHDPRVGRFFAVDPLAEKYPSWNPYNYCFNSPVIYTDPDGNDPTPFEAALMAAHVYDGKIKLEGGWQESFIYQYNVNGDNNIGLKGMMYERIKEDGLREYAYVFAGTEDIEKDGIEDISQIVGQSQQYKLAALYASNMSNYLGSDRLVFIGHSLGGGLSNMASYVTGRSSITFNPAWLSKHSKKGVKKAELHAGGYNVNYVHESDPLNKLQKSKGGGVLEQMGRNINVNGGVFSNIFTGHLMGTMVQRLYETGQNKVHKGNNEDILIHSSPRDF